MCLIANSAPVAYGGAGQSGAHAGRRHRPARGRFQRDAGPHSAAHHADPARSGWCAQFCKTRDTLAVWPGLLACGITFAGIQFFWSNFMDAALVDIMGGMARYSAAPAFFANVWQPATDLALCGRSRAPPACAPGDELTLGRVLQAWSPVPAAGRLRGGLGLPVGEPRRSTWFPGSTRFPACTCW